MKQERYVLKFDKKKGVYIVFDTLKNRSIQRLLSEIAAKKKIDAMNKDHIEYVNSLN